MSMHPLPLFAKPERHRQSREPTVFLQRALAPQPPLLVRHSLVSLQPVAPVPVKPDGQSPQTWESGVFVHTVRGSQPPF